MPSTSSSFTFRLGLFIIGVLFDFLFQWKKHYLLAAAAYYNLLVASIELGFRGAIPSAAQHAWPPSWFQIYSAPVLILRVPDRSARSFITAKKTGTKIRT